MLSGAMSARIPLLALVSLASLAACQTGSGGSAKPRRDGTPLPVLAQRDELIQPGEKHFAHLWQLTRRGNNAEGYWSFDGNKLVLQREVDGTCDRIFVMGLDAQDSNELGLVQISSGVGVTTCSYFMPGDREVIYASTQSGQDSCPARPDMSDGYVWSLHPEYEIYVQDLATRAERRITDSPGYDAEATVSPAGDRIVFTSTRSGDLELWTAALDGSDLRQVTNELGYDGGAFFSHDGKRLVFRATHFDEDGIGSRERYRDLLLKNKIRPHKLDIYTCDVDGSNRRQVTDLGGANWAPFFFPGDRRIIFSTNHHDPRPQQVEFDLFAIDDDGQNLEQITTYQGFDSFAMFSPDGEWLVFASNRGGTEAGETNLFLAKWQ
jgi:Tol biopolymer transport system component